MLRVKPDFCLSVATVFLLSFSAMADALREAAPIGWATQAGGTRGGADATPAQVFVVHNRAELLEALVKAGDAPKVVEWVGPIDMSEGRRFIDRADQQSRAEIRVPSNTTLMGVGTDAALVNGWIMIKHVDNVIIRNLKITNPCDVNPKWDPDDGDGNYNSEFDGVSLIGASHIWVDHLLFTDFPYTEDKKPLRNVDKKGVAKIIECHDGALDIKEESEYITISNTKFELHSKNNLVGHSDKNFHDEGKLTVTFALNWFQDIGERGPRVRFGRVHVYNNYYAGDKRRPFYAHKYSIGTGYRSKILSENNLFEIEGAPAGDCRAVVRNPGTTGDGAFRDSGSRLNGQALLGCTASPEVGWTVPYSYTLLPAFSLKAYVTANAGPGKL